MCANGNITMNKSAIKKTHSQKTMEVVDKFINFDIIHN